MKSTELFFFFLWLLSPEHVSDQVEHFVFFYQWDSATGVKTDKFGHHQQMLTQTIGYIVTPSFWPPDNS